MATAPTQTSLDLDHLKEQLRAIEIDLETAKATVYRFDGMSQLIKHQINQLENPTAPVNQPVE